MKYRIIQTGKKSFTVQQLIIFFWVAVGFTSYGNRFDSKKDAQEWLENLLEYQKPKVVKEW